MKDLRLGILAGLSVGLAPARGQINFGSAKASQWIAAIGYPRMDANGMRGM